MNKQDKVDEVTATLDGTYHSPMRTGKVIFNDGDNVRVQVGNDIYVDESIL